MLAVPALEHADPLLAGRGVTIAWLDSGFLPHPDIADRIVAYVDVTGEDLPLDAPLQAAQWHGTMGVVVAAGNGPLYPGIARAARIVLVRVVTRDLGVLEDNVVRGLSWVLEHRERLGIGVVNVSLGVDGGGESFSSSEVDRLAEALVAAGTVVVAAGGNRGRTDRPVPTPPANSPSVLSVGGDDEAEGAAPSVYPDSSYGITPDGLLKPEVLAPAMDLAGPRLDALDAGPPEDRWKAVEGTSFSSSIVSSIVAQILEANPDLTPAGVRQVLISSAERLPGVPMERQGFGRVNARRATDLARRRELAEEARHAAPAVHHHHVVFHWFGPTLREVALASDVDGWQLHPLSRIDDDYWTLSLRIPGPGRWRYSEAEAEGPTGGRIRYKFLLDGEEWVEDPSNLLVEPDGFGGLNSVIEVR